MLTKPGEYLNTLKKVFLFLLILYPLSSTKVLASDLVILIDSSPWMTEELVGESSKLNFTAKAVSGFLKRNKGLFGDVSVLFYNGENCDKNTSKNKRIKDQKVALKIMGFSGRSDHNVRSIEKVTSGNRAKDEIVLYISGSGGCEDNVCAKIKASSRKGGSRKFFILGLAIPDLKWMEQLKCIASSTGGKYINVSRMDDIDNSLKIIENEVAYNLEIKVFGQKGEEIKDYLSSRYGYVWSGDVYRDDNMDLVESTHIFPAKFKLKPNRYSIRVKYGNSERWLKNVVIKSHQLTTRSVSFARGSIILKVFSMGEEIFGIKRIPKPQWWCEVIPAGGTEKVDFTETFPAEIDLFEGVYDLKVHYLGREMWIKNIKVREDKTVMLEANFQ